MPNSAKGDGAIWQVVFNNWNFICKSNLEEYQIVLVENEKNSSERIIKHGNKRTNK